MTTTQAQDVVELLEAQHEEIKSMFAKVKAAQGTQKRESFEQLVRLLAIHESAEEEVVHPEARHQAGKQAVEPRLREESEAKHALSRLYDMGTDDPQFDAKLDELARAVTEHAEREEQDEFPQLRQKLPSDRLQEMTGALRAAEDTAPTRPHPHTGESATANLLAGPPMAMFDRMRDAVRDWRESRRH